MTTQQGPQLRNLLWKEVALRSAPASFTFILTAILLYFYHWGLEDHKLLIKAGAILVVISNLGRLRIAKIIAAEETVSNKNLNLIRIMIWGNTLGWSIIFALGAIGLSTTSYHMAILVTMISGFVGASIVTLAYDKLIFFPFQILMLGPVCLIAFKQWVSGTNPHAIYFVYCCVMFFIYQTRQFKISRQNIIDRLNYQIGMENSLLEVKIAQEKLVEQTATLMHASKISGLGEMAGGLSHEVNNSLQVILGSSQQIQRELQRMNFQHPGVYSKLENSINATMKIKTVVDGLRYFSQEMDAGPKQVVPLNQILDQTYGYTQELLKAHHVMLTVNKIPDVSINCHPFQITQILFNLIKNADDAIRDLNESKWIELKFEEIRDYVLIMVINSGPLIDPEYQIRLFQPFFSTKDVNAGTGLSLSISRGIALEHKGDLFYKGQEKFTTFVLKLPKAE